MLARSFFSKPNTKNHKSPLLVATKVLAPPRLPRPAKPTRFLTYPVPPERLDVFNQFLTPAGVAPRLHKTVENTEVLLQLVASGRGVTALPLWVVQAHRSRLPIVAVRLGAGGIHKHIHLGLRSADQAVPYISDLLELVRQGAAPPSGASSMPLF